MKKMKMSQLIKRKTINYALVIILSLELITANMLNLNNQVFDINITIKSQMRVSAEWPKLRE